MKSLFSVFVALAFVLSVVAPAFAADSPGGHAATGKAAATGKKEGSRTAPKTRQITGRIESLDAVSGAFAVKGRRASASLKAGDKVKLGGFAVGDRVLVRYSGDVATSVTKVPAKGAKAAASGKAPPAAGSSGKAGGK